jgi:hypothetical protein
MLLHFDPLDNTNIDVAKAFYQGIIFKAYGSCDVRDEAKHFWLRFEDKKENYSYYQFPPTENPIGYRTRLTKKDDPRSRETTGKAIALFDLLQELSSKPGNGVTFIPSSPPHFPIAERFNGSRIVHFEIDGASIESQRELINEMASVGLKATAIVNSGNKSIYPYFVTSENLTADQFRYLKRSFLPFDCDENVANSLIGGGRFAGVTRQSTGKEQSLESLNDITYSFSELSRLLELFYLSKNLEFESFEKYQARKEVESENLQNESFSLNDYKLSDIENLLIELDQLFLPYQSGNQTYNYRLNIAIAIASMGLGDKAEELCPNLFGGTNIKFSSLSAEKFKFNNPLGCILSQSRKWLNDNDLQYPDWFKNMYKQQQKSNVINFPKSPSIFSKEGFLADLKSLLGKGFSDSELSAEKTAIAKKYGLTLNDIDKQYQILLKELENNDSRQDNKTEIEALINAKSQRLKLDHLVPQTLADGLNNRANLMALRPECFLTTLIVGLSSVCNPKTKVILNKNTDFSVNAGMNGGIVANTAQKKSPIIKTTTSKPLFKIQAQYQEIYEAELQEYEIKLSRYEALKKDPKKADALSDEFPDGPPIKPTCQNAIITDATGEALKAAIASQTKGTLLLSDELAGLFKAANQYRGGKGSDIEDMLSLYDGQGFNVLRKSGSCFVPQALLSILGTIQPDVLRKMLGDGKDSNGQWSRFVWVEQPLVAGKMPRDCYSIDIDPMIESLYDRFLGHAMNQDFDHTYTLSRQAFLMFADTYDELETLRVNAGENPMGSVYGKSEGRIGKLAIILHLIKHLFNNQAVPNIIEADTIQAAITLTRFYIYQVQSIYGQLVPDGQSLAPILFKIQTMAQSKGEITARQVKQFTRAKESTEAINQYFRELESMGLGETIVTSKSFKYRVSVASADKCRQFATPVESLSSNDCSPSVASADKKTKFYENLDSPHPSQSVEDSNKELATLATLEGQILTEQDLGCADTLLHLSALDNDQDTATPTEQASQEVQTLSTVATVAENSEPNYWVNYNGQELKPDDFVHHRDYGTCKVILATGNTVKLDKDSVTISSDPSFLTHVWEPVAYVS